MTVSLRTIAALAVLALAAPLAARAQTAPAYTINAPESPTVSGRYATDAQGRSLRGPHGNILEMVSRSEQACERMESIDPDFPPQCINLTTRYFCSYEVYRMEPLAGVPNRVALYRKPEAFCGIGSPSQVDYTGMYLRADYMRGVRAPSIQVVRE